jgi:hypothetical protein
MDEHAAEGIPAETWQSGILERLAKINADQRRRLPEHRRDAVRNKTPGPHPGYEAGSSNAEIESGRSPEKVGQPAQRRGYLSDASRTHGTGSGIQTRFLGKVVPRGGFEPPTRGFSVRCSTN